MKTIQAAVALAVVLTGLSSVRANAACARPETVLTSPAWQAFLETVTERYLAPEALEPAGVPPTLLAKVLGHALARQAHFVGSDPTRRSAFDCLRSGITRSLDRLDRDLAHFRAGAASTSLAELAEEARTGFFDDEIIRLTGVGPEADMPSVLERSVEGTVAELAPQEEEAVATAVAVRLRPRCRFLVDPDLYTSASPRLRWYLIREPRGDGAYRYLTGGFDPDWPAGHKGRPESRLSAGAELVLIGSKKEILGEIARLNAEVCR